MQFKYKHHIIPRHAGGTDDPFNLIELMIEEHAEAHRKLYEEYGRWQDFVAWQALSKTIGKEEIIKLTQSLATKGKKQSPEHVEKRVRRGEKNGMFGRSGDLSLTYGLRGKLSPNYGKKQSAETIRKRRLSLINRSYEDLHGVERAKEIKNKLRKPKTKVVTRVFDRKENDYI